MYTRCLFCAADLGRNEAVAAFPVGRRLAFDAAKGRLWVVCPRCARWNLTPLEERWEAVEQAERLYRGARRRVSTDNVGLARVADGTELVRVGTPLRPEFAAWRYGRQFVRRMVRRRAVVLAGFGAVAGGGYTLVAASGAALGGTVGGSIAGTCLALYAAAGLSAYSEELFNRAVGRNHDRVVAWLPGGGDQRLLPVTFGAFAEARLARGPAGELAVDVAHQFGRRAYTGEEAARALALLTPHLNRGGARGRVVREAVQAIERRGSADAYLRALARTVRRSEQARDPSFHTTVGGEWVPDAGLFRLSVVDRLALEMALHEESERRATGGELADLERAWREAEEIAAIADDLLVPDGVRGAFARLARRAGSGAG